MNPLGFGMMAWKSLLLDQHHMKLKSKKLRRLAKKATGKERKHWLNRLANREAEKEAYQRDYRTN